MFQVHKLKVKDIDWTIKEIKKVLNSLKHNKSFYHFGLIYEVFRPNIINNDLLSIAHM